jgi:F plasmid transfer operon protein TraF
MILTTQNYSAAGRHVISLSLLFLFYTMPVHAQIVEAAGSRALGMGGAFVAVASDSSATWWNPAGLGAGPFVDLTWAVNLVETTERGPAWRDRTSWFALGTPPVGFSYYRFRITDIQPLDATGQTAAGREDGRAVVPVRSLSASQLGITLVRTLIPGVHAGTTLKYLRGTVRGGRGDSLARPSDLLVEGEALDGGDADSRFDLDVGVIGIAGPVRLGVVVRNVREPEFAGPGSTSEALSTRMQLPRQIRAGAAFDAEGTGIPLTVAFDADVREYATPSGARQIVALGAENWFLARRLGVRAGGRLNTRGARTRSATAGLTVAMRGGLYLDGHAVRGGSGDEKGWGLGARVSF